MSHTVAISTVFSFILVVLFSHIDPATAMSDNNEELQAAANADATDPDVVAKRPKFGTRFLDESTTDVFAHNAW